MSVELWHVLDEKRFQCRHVPAIIPECDSRQARELCDCFLERVDPILAAYKCDPRIDSVRHVASDDLSMAVLLSGPDQVARAVGPGSVLKISFLEHLVLQKWLYGLVLLLVDECPTCEQITDPAIGRATRRSHGLIVEPNVQCLYLVAKALVVGDSEQVVHTIWVEVDHFTREERLLEVIARLCLKEAARRPEVLYVFEAEVRDDGVNQFCRAGKYRTVAPHSYRIVRVDSGDRWRCLCLVYWI